MGGMGNGLGPDQENSRGNDGPEDRPETPVRRPGEEPADGLSHPAPGDAGERSTDATSRGAGEPSDRQAGGSSPGGPSGPPPSSPPPSGPPPGAAASYGSHRSGSAPLDPTAGIGPVGGTHAGGPDADPADATAEIPRTPRPNRVNGIRGGAGAAGAAGAAAGAGAAARAQRPWVQQPPRPQRPVGEALRRVRALSEEQQRRPQKDPGSRWKRIGRTAAVTVLCLAVVGALIVFIAYESIDIPSANVAYTKQTTHIYYADGKHEVGRFVSDSQNRDKLSYDQIPEVAKQAAVAAEDRTFWKNNGVDFKGILRAVFSNATTNSTSGASTITQQYVKNLYLTQERTYTRKVKEAVISLKLAHRDSKEEILAGYLNTIYFGRGAYGIEAASQAYFNKPAKELSLQEAAALSAIINDPSGLDPANGPDSVQALSARYRYVLSGMAKLGYVDQAKADAAAAKLPVFPKPHKQDTFSGQRGHAMQLVRQELLRLKDKQGNPLFTEDEINGGGLKVTTTLSRKAMRTSREAAEDERPEGHPGYIKDPNRKADELHIGTATVDVHTGALVGFYGGQDYLDSQINWAAYGGMAGSSMKPFTLAAALSEGYSLKDSWDGNSPKQFPGVTVRNEGVDAAHPYGNSYGTVSSLSALVQSINTAFVDMSSSLDHGSKDVYDMAVKAGIPPSKPDPNHPGFRMNSIDFDPDNFLITLGRQVISPINMADAYATIADGGVHHNVHVVSKVVDAYGKTVYKWSPKGNTSRAMSEDVADDVSYAMQQVVDDPEGTGTAAQAIRQPAAGKTGTATNDDDNVSSAWFTGFTPQLATSVVYTRGKGSGALDEGFLDTYFGADHPADTWVKIMGPLTDDLDYESFPPPAWVDGVAPKSGHAPYVPPPPPPAPEQKKPEKPKPSKKPVSKEPQPSPPSTPVPPTTAPPSTAPTTAPTEPGPGKPSKTTGPTGGGQP